MARRARRAAVTDGAAASSEGVTAPTMGDARKVLVAGATGALGRQLVPRLVAAGHAVAGVTRSPRRRDVVSALGATPVVADALDPDAVARAVAAAAPEVVVH
jgi:nucleoside-diphosphate-sugar epimerase